MTIQLKIPNMACGACGKTIAKAIQSIDPNAEVQTDPKTKQVTVETIASLTSVRNAIAAAGYPAA
ncbi:heavy-metal-associated domain-containing protein [Myxosarcina sp. GI1]|uniref:heavy-metal-associated domain-containing protein n=1 Tax=Myxosarcina sp. GI1 TaxID=1541065 RepID=UPI000565166C|nr:heavy-metal-associated domain-containing protein [Myxosarcina sp. GI1]